MASTWAHATVDDLIKSGALSKRNGTRLKRYLIEDEDGYLVTQGAFNSLLARLKTAEQSLREVSSAVVAK